MKDCVEIDGKQYPVLFCWETTARFIEDEDLPLTGVDDISKLRPRQVTSLIYQGVVVGCEDAKIDFPFSKAEFARAIQPVHVGQLLTIYARHTTSTRLNVKKKRAK